MATDTLRGPTLRWLPGEMTPLLVDGQNPVPQALLNAGYRFAHPDLGEALASLAAPTAPTPRAVPSAAKECAPGVAD